MFYCQLLAANKEPEFQRAKCLPPCRHISSRKLGGYSGEHNPPISLPHKQATATHGGNGPVKQSQALLGNV